MQEFLDTLVKTNRYHRFFVDWDKTRRYRGEYQDELALLGAMSEPGADPEATLTRLIMKYPRIAELLPLLLAIRPKNNKLVVVDEVSLKDVDYNFKPEKLDESSVKKIIEFAEKTGILAELGTIKNPIDYYFGVEVGSDTNARKNRSGKAMEDLIEPFVRELVEKNHGQFLKQKSFSEAANAFGVNVPASEANKRGDFMIYVNNIPINIEVNFFDGGGSKQEIMNSYIPRAQSLKNAGWKFALVTDGAGWMKNKNQVELGFKTIKNIYNAKMCRDGQLEKILVS